MYLPVAFTHFAHPLTSIILGLFLVSISFCPLALLSLPLIKHCIWCVSLNYAPVPFGFLLFAFSTMFSRSFLLLHCFQRPEGMTVSVTLSLNALPIEDSHPTASEQRASCSVCPRALCQALCGLCAQEWGRGSRGARMQSPKFCGVV